MVDTRRHPTPPNRTRALVIGESLMDIIRPINDDSRPMERPGGSPMNTSLGLARQGVDVQFITELGADAYGDEIEEKLVRAGVDVLAGMRTGCTNIAYADLRADGSADFHFDIEWCLEHGAVAHAPVDVVHFGSLGAALMPGAQTVEDLVRAARSTSTISFDPNIRPVLDHDLEAARDRVERQARLSDIVKVSEEDLAHVYGSATHDSIARRWLAAGVSLVVITRAERGMLLLTRTARVDLAGRDADVVDTIGAGDAANAGLIAGLGTLGYLGAASRERLRSIDRRVLRAVGEWAQQTALLTIEQAGAEPPTSAETRDALRGASPRRTLVGSDAA